ncbi:hypothetical protein EYY94_09335, partial [Obesumbacterium proteus]|uniref:RHS repeat-associated core domain-containing protein n=1 Tax=Obesumbacterium proteus TaxID=82983 RepID=UPI0010EC7F49
EAFMADMRHPGNRLSEDAHFYYQYDQYGNLSQKVSKRDAGEVHHYRYDRSHRLVSYLCAQDGEALRGGRYCYDPLGRRIGKQVMQRNQPKHISWFGWDGDKLVLTERDGTRIHTVYLPHSFVPLLRFEGDKPPTVTPLADKLEQEAGITLPPDFKHTLHHIEQALRANRLSTEQHAWLNQVQLSPEYLATLLDPLPDTPYAAQLYDCNHLGTPQQLINLNGHIDWSITLDAWGNALSEENPHQLHQPIRMQGQQYDEESGLHYNRHRYYDPTIGRYITQDPIGLDGGLNLYMYPLNPVTTTDPLGRKGMRPDGHPWGYGCGDESSDWYVPDSLGAAKFLPACRKHDICYGTLGSNKAICDENLGKNMKLACSDDLRGLHALYRPICNGMANAYEFAVSRFGDSAFSSAQKLAASDFQELEMLDLLRFNAGVYVDPTYHKKIYDQVTNPQ